MHVLNKIILSNWVNYVQDYCIVVPILRATGVSGSTQFETKKKTNMHVS